MLKGELPGVEHEAGHLWCLPGGVGVDGITQNRTAKGLFHVDANLMGASGEKPALDQCGALVSGERSPLSHSLLARAVKEDGAAFPVHGMSANEVLDPARVLRRAALDGGEVDLRDPAGREGVRQLAMSAVVLGDDHATAGVFVEPVDNAGAEFAADAREIGAVVEKGVDQSAVRISRSRVHDEARGLVYDDDVAVLVENREGNVLGFDRHGFGIGDGDGDGIARAKLRRGLGGPVIQGDVTVLDQILQTRA